METRPGTRTAGIASRTGWLLCALPFLFPALGCATARETVQECKQSAYAYCAKQAGAKDPKSAGWGPQGAARELAYQQCLDTQLAACGAP
jgi:hypothetical protein